MKQYNPAEDVTADATPVKPKKRKREEDNVESAEIEECKLLLKHSCAARYFVESAVSKVQMCSI